MENYDRVIELKNEAENSDGAMMEASAKQAESLEGKLNLLTNATQNFYGQLMNSDSCKTFIELLADMINGVVDIANAMEGKWTVAIGVAMGALITFKKVMSGLKWSEFIQYIIMSVGEMMGLKTAMDVATVSAATFKAVIGGLVVGAVIGGISWLVGQVKQAEENFNNAAASADNLRNTLNGIDEKQSIVEDYRLACLKLDDLNEGSEQWKTKHDEIVALQEQIASWGGAYKSIIDQQNSSLDDQVAKMNNILDLEAREAINEQLKDVSSDRKANNKANDYSENVEDIVKNNELIETYKKLYDETSQRYREARTQSEKEAIDADLKAYEGWISELENANDRLISENLDIEANLNGRNEILKTADEYNKYHKESMVSVDEDAKSTFDNILKAERESEGIKDNMSESADSAGQIADALTDANDGSTTSVKEANEQYVEQLQHIQNIQSIIDDINENGLTVDAMDSALNSGALDDYKGSITDAAALQEHLNGKIKEAEDIANQAYYNMLKDDEAFWKQKMANSDAWKTHEQEAQNAITKLAAEALNIQEADFSNFISEKGGLRQVDYSNCNTMAQAENNLQRSLASQILSYASQITNSKAGYRKTDMSNIAKFLNTQEAKEAQTVQELAALWAKYYDAKQKALNQEITQYNQRVNEIMDSYNYDFGEEAFMEDGALKHQMLNSVKELEKLKKDNVAFTNYFNAISTSLGGVGGGLSQSYTGGGGVTSGILNNSRPSTGSGSSGGSHGGSGSGGSGSGGGSSKQEVEDMELEIDRYYNLNDAINDVEKALSKLQTQRNAIGTKEAYRKSIQQEIKLINDQIQAYKNLQAEQKREEAEIKRTLQQNGFSFDGDGDISNYASRLQAMVNSANSKSGASKESAIGHVNYINDLIKKYGDLHNNAIPDTETTIIELGNSIKDLNKDLEENMENIETLRDLYYDLEKATTQYENSIALNDLKQEYALGKEKVDLMNEELSILKKQQALAKSKETAYRNSANALKKELANQGVKFNGDGTIANYEAITTKHENKINTLVGTSKDDAMETYQALLDKMQEYDDLVLSSIPEMEQAWKEYANSIEALEREKAQMVVDIQKDIASALEKVLQEEYNAIKESIQKQKELFNEKYEEEDHDRQVAEYQTEIDEIKQQIAIVSRDTTEAGKLRVKQLMEELEEAEKAFNDYMRDYGKEQGNNRFDEELGKLDEELETLLTPENLTAMVNQALTNGFINVGGQVTQLDSLMKDWLDETGDGLYALGNILKTELVGNLESAKILMKELGIKGKSVDLSSVNAISSKYTTDVASRAIGNNQVNVEIPVTVQGNLDNVTMDMLKSELNKTASSVIKQISRANR